MKKSVFILAAIVAVAFSSCKKDRTCECTTSTSGSSSSTTSTKTLLKVTSGQAKAQCVSSKWDDTFMGATYTTTRTCTLK